MLFLVFLSDEKIFLFSSKIQTILYLFPTTSNDWNESCTFSFIFEIVETYLSLIDEYVSFYPIKHT